MSSGDATSALVACAAVSAIPGIVLGALAALLWRARREQAQRVEVGVLSAPIKSEVFLQPARERLERQSLDASPALKERERAIDSLIQPIRDALTKTETQMQNIERDRIDAFAHLKSQMEVLASGRSRLSRETRNLVTTLRRPEVRGQWGEITLKRLVELSGMTPHVDFTEHRQFQQGGGLARTTGAARCRLGGPL